MTDGYLRGAVSQSRASKIFFLAEQNPFGAFKICKIILKWTKIEAFASYFNKKCSFIDHMKHYVKHNGTQEMWPYYHFLNMTFKGP